MIDEDAIRYRWDTVGSKLDERGRRLFAAAEVRTAGWGGLAVVSRITGLARSTINRGDDDLDANRLPRARFVAPGAGVGLSPRSIPASFRNLRGSSNPRPWAIPCGP
jgi:hypothetical protein